LASRCRPVLSSAAIAATSSIDTADVATAIIAPYATIRRNHATAIWTKINSKYEANNLLNAALPSVTGSPKLQATANKCNI
jgi:hypothetical protein